MSSGRHRQQPPSRPGRGRHRKPPPRSRVVVPLVTTAAVLTGGGVALAITLPANSTGGTSAGLVTSGPPVPTATPATLPGGLSLLDSASPTPAHTTASHRPVRAKPRRATTRRRVHRTPDVLSVDVTGGASYLAVSHDGHLLTQRILHHGERAVFRRHGLDVVIGNAGGVRLSIDGHRAYRPGSHGQVRRFVVR